MKTKFTLVIVLIIALFTPGSAQWTNITTNATQELNAVAFSGNNGVIGGISGNFLYSSDAGLTWQDSVYYPYDEIHAAAFASPTVAIMGSLNNFYRSTNSGADFTGPDHHGTWGTCQDIVFTSATNGYAIDDYCSIATTTDGGQSWAITAHACANNSTMHDLDFPTASVGYACGANGNVVKTTDGGATWASVTAPGVATVAYTAMQFFDTNTGYIGGRTGTGQDTFVFKKTTDGGATWIDMKYGMLNSGIGFGSAIQSFSFVDQNTGYLVLLNKIYKTTDGAASWTLDYTSTVGVSDFNKIVVSPNVIMAVGTNGLAARLTGTQATGITETKSIKALSVYPNPSSSTITLGSFLVANQNAFLEITDAGGRIVKAEKIATNEVDIAPFSPGIYFGKLISSDQNTYTFKFVKQ